MNWYLDVLKNYAGFSGRARRKEYWMFALFNLIVFVILLILSLATKFFLILYFIYALAVLVPSLAVLVRRLHDQDKSGGWFFISFIPFVGPIWLLVLLCLEGTRGPNRFGPDPKAGEASAAPAYPSYPTA